MFLTQEMLRFVLLSFFYGFLIHHVTSEFTVANYYGNHMVLQKAPKRSLIWGYANGPDIAVNVTLTGFSTSTTYSQYDSTIKKFVWRSLLPAVTDVSLSYNITAASGQNTVHIVDVLFGDVWLCSGQSNMQFTLSMVFNATEEIADAKSYPNIRVFTVGPRYSDDKKYDVTVQEAWSVPSKDSIGHSDWSYFSAVCWLYGKYLYQRLKYPIGLISSTWGGTPIEAWSSKTAIDICKPLHVSNQTKLPTSDPYPQNEPTRLWNAMIHPLLNMTIYGAIWYQGESNALNPALYRCQFPVMISDWRKKFHLGSFGQTDPSFPFGFVQLAPWRNDSSITRGFPDLRWSQTAYFGYSPNPQMPGTFMAVAMDLPDFSSPYVSIHPRDKQDVASRLALAGLAVAYNQTVGQFQGPLATAYAIPKGVPVVQIFFDNSAKVHALSSNSFEVRSPDGFEFCCSKNNYSLCDGHDSQWIKAPIIQHDGYSVSLQMIGDCQNQWVMGIRYAWRESPCPFKKCAIYSKEHSLPMGPYIYKGLIGRFIPERRSIHVY